MTGVGTGLFVGPNMVVAMQQAPRHLLATAGAATELARSLAFALGPAICTIPWALAAYSEAGMRAGAAVTAGSAVLGVLVTVVGLTRRGAASSEPEAAPVDEAA